MRMTKTSRPLATLARAVSLGAVAAIVACGGGGTTGDGGGTGQCLDDTGFDGQHPAVQFSTDVLPILRGSCGIAATCHGSPSPPSAEQHFLGPPESAGPVDAAQIQAILAGIVGQPAVEEPDMDVIKPSDPQHSFLLYKIGGLGCPTLGCAAGMTCGDPMPLDGPPLAQGARDTLRRWVAQGAKGD